jgi:hypothetical protein
MVHLQIAGDVTHWQAEDGSFEGGYMVHVEAERGFV